MGAHRCWRLLLSWRHVSDEKLLSMRSGYQHGCDRTEARAETHGLTSFTPEAKSWSISGLVLFWIHGVTVTSSAEP
jgi:hypothetical protein